ncbi:MAG: HAMP domain-containing sensor histidine kinase [Bacteroidota bacterium]|nr:HAMP domain-containing sensor histidine kinase [Bacteroidota bacterium]
MEIQKKSDELIISKKEFAMQNEEKEKRNVELIIANKKIDFKNRERDIRTAELNIANRKLAFQNEEKETRAAELMIANKELAFQNKEKENRAAELIIANMELTKTNSELDRFVYSVSHDLRAPLTSILGLLSFIEGESKEADTLEHANMIRSRIIRLDGFIKKILSYSQNNRTDIDVEFIPLQKTIEETYEMLRSIKDAEGIHFEVIINEEQSFYSDLQRFTTVIENLISNAIKYHKKPQTGRYIKVTGNTTREHLHLKVEDNGIGIAQEFHDKIFEMFYHLPGKQSGTGIGLYIVKEIIEKLDGSIRVRSEAGTGTSFEITIKNTIT